MKYLLLSAVLLFSTFAPALEGQDKSTTVINGSFTSSFDLQDERTFPDGGFRFRYGWINTANLRLKATVNESLSFLISANFTALNGLYAGLAAAAFIPELERLSFKVKTEALDVEAGLIRIPRGYGYLFSPLEILNPKDSMNSLDPSGRPAGKWGVHAFFYPQDMWKVEFFGLLRDDLDPADPLASQGWGSKFGAATTFSVDNWNFDILYALILPEVPFGSDPVPAYRNNDFTQMAGFAFKADLGIGLFVEALYRFDYRMLRTGLYYGKPLRGFEGLEAAAGADYTFSEQNLYLLCEYMFYGPGEVDWGESSLDSLYSLPGWDTAAPADRLALRDWNKKPLPYARHDYLFLLLRYSPGQDLNLGLSALAGLDDQSCLATAFCEYEIVQGLSLQASALVPIDRRMFDGITGAGEWGSVALGFHQMTRLGVKVKF
jgi:hypothetical protein